jgi:starch synthase (maltosyl-transferring)
MRADGYLPIMSADTAQTSEQLDERDPTRQPPRRIVIQYPAPSVDDGRYPVKRCAGDRVTVEADVFRDGHDLLRAVISYLGPDDTEWREAEMRRIDAHLGGVRWAGEFEVDRSGRWEYTIQAWTDVFGTWRDELERKVAAGQQDQPDDASAARSGEAGRRAGGWLAGELSEGVVLLRAAAERADTTAQ